MKTGTPTSRRKLRINVARTAGFCFGVRRAIRIAMDLASGGRDGRTAPRVCMIGDLVHNQTVIRRLEKAGIKKITRLGDGRGKVLLIRAHGTGQDLIASARAKGFKIVDATCPMVHAIHKIVRKMDAQDRRIIVLGDRHHEEVLGIVGQVRGPVIVIDRLSRIPAAVKKIRKAAVVVQSTQNADDILPIVAKLRKMIPDLKFFNTICNPTRTKQAEMKDLPRRNEVVIVIGSRSSANTRRLYEIARARNPRSRWIESASELRPAWFRNVRSVGITSGASTPQATTDSVIGRIREIARMEPGR